MRRIACVLAWLVLATGAANAAVIIIDDHGVGEQGSGTFALTNTSKGRAKSGMYHPGGSGDGCYLLDNGYTATWTPTLTAGPHLVEVWNPTDATAIVTNTTTVSHAGGSTDYVFKQTSAGGHWAALGFHTFNAGTGGNVSITGANYGYADAVRFSTGDEPMKGAFGLGQTFAWSAVGDWDEATSGDDYVTRDAGDVFTWALNVVPGAYEIDFRYLYDDDRSPDTVVQVWDGGTQLGSDLVLDQNGVNSDPLEGTKPLGTYTFSGSTAEVRVIASGNLSASVLGVDAGWVPEPATLTLLAAGAAGVLAARRRR